MILVTVGAQMPFDRMVRLIDGWAGERNRTDIFAQIGPTRWRPENIEWTEFLSPSEFSTRFRQADAIVSHAGMGSILTAMQHGKPILIMPRLGDLHETRNDHQVATAMRFQDAGHVALAITEVELAEQIDGRSELAAPRPIRPRASESLLATIETFIGNVGRLNAPQGSSATTAES